eukprot:m.51927 g.51927  ORF g.51927 m.51927 type:complete len:239 (-) comp11268_c1_seq1:362-1078(-)
MMGKALAALCLLCVAGFEAVCWYEDPFGVHTALNDGNAMENADRVRAAIANALPHLLLALTLSCSMTNLSAGLLGILVMFTGMQLFFWWIPYLFGFSTHMYEEHRLQLTAVQTIKPFLFEDALLPDMEHALLFPLTLVTLLLSIQAYLGTPSTSCRREALLLLVASVVLAAFPFQIETWDPASKQPPPLAGRPEAGITSVFIGVTLCLIAIIRLGQATDSDDDSDDGEAMAATHRKLD